LLSSRRRTDEPTVVDVEFASDIVLLPQRTAAGNQASGIIHLLVRTALSFWTLTVGGVKSRVCQVSEAESFYPLEPSAKEQKSVVPTVVRKLFEIGE